MNKAPAFQFYAQDFLTGVMFLTNEEKGIYITLLAKQWTDGKLPLKRIEFLTQKVWDSLSIELKNKFKTDGEFIWNERLELERKKQREKSKKAKESAEKRWQKPTKEPLKSDKTEPMRTHKKRISEKDAFLEDRSMKYEDEVEKEKGKGSLREKPKANKLKKSEVIYPFDSDDFKEHWQIWKEFKQKEFGFKYKSELSEQGALIKLSELSSNNQEVAIKIIHQSISEGWKGLFNLKNNGNRDSNNAKSDSDLKRSASNAVDKMFSGQ